MKTLITLISTLLVLLTAAPLHAAPLPEKADVLASNTVIAKYTGVRELPCRFRTALCPDRCNHATRLATFEVINNEAYERPGMYGDAPLAPGDEAVIDVMKDILGQPAEVNEAISNLKIGDMVRLTIVHYYVQQGQGQFPVRPAVKLEQLPDPTMQK